MQVERGPLAALATFDYKTLESSRIPFSVAERVVLVRGWR